MNGLLKKDLFVADKSGRLLIILALVFSIMPSMETFGSTYCLLIAFMIPLNSIAYDEKSKWDRYAAMLPYTPKQIVFSKYLIGGIYALIGEIIIILGALVRGALKPGSVDWADTWGTSLMLVVAIVTLSALAYPAIYRFGTEKGRLVLLVVMGAAAGAMAALTGVLLDNHVDLRSAPWLVAVLVVIAVGALCLSFRLSVRFYRKRVGGAYA